MMQTPSDLPAIPMWVAIVVTGLCLLGAAFALLGSIGMVRFKTMYDRMHASTLASTLGMGVIMVAMIVYFSIIDGTLALKPLLIGIFMTVTTPVTLTLLARASVYRDRVEGREGIPKDDL